MAKLEIRILGEIRIQFLVILLTCGVSTGCSVARLPASGTKEPAPERQELVDALRAQQELERRFVVESSGASDRANAARRRIESRVQMLSSMDGKAGGPAPVPKLSRKPLVRTASHVRVVEEDRASNDDALVGCQSIL